MGFWRRVRDLNPGGIIHTLRDFESRLFDHLSNSPYFLCRTRVLYQLFWKKSSCFSVTAVLFRKLQNFVHLSGDLLVIFPLVGAQAKGAVLDALFRITEISAAAIPQGVQRTVAEQAAEPLRVRVGMAGKKLTFPILEKIIMAHWIISFPLFYRKRSQGNPSGGSCQNSSHSPVPG